MLNKRKAVSLLNEEINRLKKMSYQELQEKVDKTEVKDYGDPSDMGNFYQTEIQVFYDDRKSKNIRVVVNTIIGYASVGLSKSPSDDFIMTPEGNLLGD